MSYHDLLFAVVRAVRHLDNLVRDDQEEVPDPYGDAMDAHNILWDALECSGGLALYYQVAAHAAQAVSR